MQVFEQLLVTSPRRSRKSVREALECLERAAEMVDGAWCDAMSACGNEELSALADRLLALEGIGVARLCRICRSDRCRWCSNWFAV